MPKPKIYYIKGKKYKGIELTLEEQQALCRKNLKLIKEQTVNKTPLNILENIVDLSPEYSKVIDDNFWKLV